MAQWLANPTRNRRVAGSIPGLTQWVNDPELPWAKGAALEKTKKKKKQKTKLRMELPRDHAIPLLGIYLERAKTLKELLADCQRGWWCCQEGLSTEENGILKLPFATLSNWWRLTWLVGKVPAPAISRLSCWGLVLSPHIKVAVKERNKAIFERLQWRLTT